MPCPRFADHEVPRSSLPPTSTRIPSRRTKRQSNETSADPETKMSIDPAPDYCDSLEPRLSRKSKGKTRATTADLDEPANANGGGNDPRDIEDGWDASQLLEARQESMRLTRRDRTSGWLRGDESQAEGAGPSRARQDPNGNRSATTPPGLPTVREGRASHGRDDDWQRGQSCRTSGVARGSERMARGTYRDTYRHARNERAFSEYRPLPNTRAADFLAGQDQGQQRFPQRSPMSRIRGLQRTPSPSPRPRRSDSMSVLMTGRLDRSEGAGERDRVRYNGGLNGAQVSPEAEETDDEDGEWDDHEGNDREDVRLRQDDDEGLPTALWGSTALNDGVPTPVPVGGFPAIHKDDPESNLRGMALEWMREVWSDPPHADVLVEVYNYRYTEDDAANRRIAESLRWAFEHMTGESNFDVVPPETEDTGRRRARDLPTTWAVRGLTPRGTAIAVERGTWSFQTISFFAAPRATRMQNWLFALEGFLEPNEEKIRAAVLRVLHEEELQRWMLDMVASNPALSHMSATRALEDVLESLGVDVIQLGNGGTGSLTSAQDGTGALPSAPDGSDMWHDAPGAAVWPTPRTSAPSHG
ncbi:hypothetical protein C8T65DRAFT_738349 [Cerioporus squamosus]|nr:hypothetical protein C8T65DRAFT_738349 [Cerioporus squamosus]